MSLLLNGAGASAADPILNGLGIEWVIAASTMDAATFTDAGIDTASGFPVTNSVASQLSPASSVTTQGNAGSYDHTAHQYAISSTTGLSVGDYIYLSGGAGGGSITAGIYKIASIPSAGLITLSSDPLSGAGSDVTGIAYEVAWRTTTTVAGTAPSVSSSGGQVNYYKADLADSVGNHAQTSDTNYIRNAPALSGTTYIAINSLSADGTHTTNVPAATLAVLSAWANFGGVGIVAMTNHSVQTRNDFQWADTTAGEKALSYATTGGNFRITGADGTKYGRLLLKSLAGGVAVGIDIAIVLDTTAPTIIFQLNGR